MFGINQIRPESVGTSIASLTFVPEMECAWIGE